VQGVTPRPSHFIPTTPASAKNYTMTVPDEGDPEGDSHHPVSSIHDGDDHRYGGDHHHEKHVSCEAKSHCDNGCCADDEKDCESSVYSCENSCCGHDNDDHCVDKEDRRGTGLALVRFFLFS
jgi:hypothetical protein